MKIIDNAKMASVVWNDLNIEQQKAIKKSFHLRPTNSGVSIISTMPSFPMRGITNVSNKKDLKKILEGIFSKLKKIYSTEEKDSIKVLKGLGFPKRGESSKKELEEDIQALMIRNMMTDENLRKRLNAANKIRFIASEFILKQGNNRIDIIGFDEKDLYFFELKKERTTKVDQVKNYVDYYSEEQNLKVLKDVLRNYPINPVSEFGEIKGVMVMQYSENSFNQKKWGNLAKSNSIDIIFFEKSLLYR